MPSIRRNGSFLLKAALAVGLIAAADGLFYAGKTPPGWTIGLFALALLGAALTTHPALRRSRAALCLSLLAFLFALLQIETVSLLAWILYWLALMLAVMASRAGGPPDVWPWLQRLVLAGFYALIKPVLDGRRLARVSASRGKISFKPLLPVIVVPAIGGALFLLLFATANPVISTTLGGLTWPDIDGWRLAFWGFALIVGWCVVRPPFRRRFQPKKRPAAATAPLNVSSATVLVSLAVFNALFAVENGLDLAFLWSGAPLPGKVTMADYAHQGAFSLIVAALLVAGFVLVALDPRSPAAGLKSVRRLVILWIAQTVFLVGSCILRTWDYALSYSLTGLRVCAFAWMALVALGLVLVCWRLLRGKSSAWLINANVAAAGAVLAATSIVDVNGLAAEWNVRNAREVGGRGVELDVCYLQGLNESAAVPLAELLQKPIGPQLRGRVVWALASVMQDSEEHRRQWRSWTWRRTRRLARADAMTHGLDWASASVNGCAPVTPAASSTPSPLTSAPPE